MSIWGYCEECDRWFPHRAERATEWVCASCGMGPLLIEDRALHVVGAPRRAGA